MRKVSIIISYRDYVSCGDPVALIVPEEINNFISDCISMRAYRRTEERGGYSEDTPIDLFPGYSDGLIYAELPAGVWRVYYVKKTIDSVEGKENYIDMLSSESCDAMIHSVYEPHYQHFGEEFGKTLKGFFSDEPSFSNAVNSYYSTLGTEDMLIPWSDELHKRISVSAGISKERVLELLPALWYEIGSETKRIRHHYMNEVTQLYQRNFVNRLGSWCREHGVMYIQCIRRIRCLIG